MQQSELCVAESMSTPDTEGMNDRDYGEMLVQVLTVKGASPILSVINAGRALAYCIPREESGESPPIRPSTLN